MELFDSKCGLFADTIYDDEVVLNKSNSAFLIEDINGNNGNNFPLANDINDRMTYDSNKTTDPFYDSTLVDKILLQRKGEDLMVYFYFYFNFIYFYLF